jgi:hypothetical protein
MRVASAVLHLLAGVSLLASSSCGLDGSKCKCGGYLGDSGSDAGAVVSHDAAAPNEVVRSEAFWSAFRIDGEWVEYQPTLVALAEHADLVATGTITGMGKPLTTQGDAAEDVVTEATLLLTIDRSTNATFGPGTSVTVTMVSAQQLTELEQARLTRLLPSSKVLVLLRKRNDNGLFRIVNGFGLWSATTRSALDCPIEAYPDTCERLLTEAGAGGSLEALATKVGL